MEIKELIEKIKIINVKSQTQFCISIEILNELISNNAIQEIKETLKDKNFNELIEIFTQCTKNEPYSCMARKSILNVLEAFYPEKLENIDEIVKRYEIDLDFNTYVREKEREEEIIRHISKYI